MPLRIVGIIPIPKNLVQTIKILDQDVFKFGRAYEIPVTIFTEAYANTLWWKLPSYKNVSTTRNFRRRHNKAWDRDGFLVERERIKVGDFIIRPELDGNAAIIIEYDGDIVPGSHAEAFLKTIISRINSTLPEPSGMMPAPNVNFKGIPATAVARIKEYAMPAAEATNPLLRSRSRSRSRSGCCRRTKKKNK